MADEPKTDATTAQTGTPTQGAKAATVTGNDKPEHVPYERFQGVVAERERFKEKYETLEQKYTELEGKHKTESQKLIDAGVQRVVDAEWKPKGERLSALEAEYKADVDELLAKIPEEHKAAVDTNAPIEVQRKQAKALVAAFESAKGSTRINGGASPAGESAPRTYTFEQWTDFQNMAREDYKGFMAIKEEMYAAAREGRVAGLRGAVGPRN